MIKQNSQHQRLKNSQHHGLENSQHQRLKNSQHHGLENSQNHGLNGLKDDTDLKSENNQKKSVKSVQSFKIRDSDNIPQLRFPEFKGAWDRKKVD